MEVEIPGLGTGLVLIAVGLTLMGYFIGNGLRNLGHADKDYKNNFLVRESELAIYLNLNRNEIEELLRKYPDAPKIELKETTYYPYKQFMEWIISRETYKH